MGHTQRTAAFVKHVCYSPPRHLDSGTVSIVNTHYMTVFTV